MRTLWCLAGSLAVCSQSRTVQYCTVLYWWSWEWDSGLSLPQIFYKTVVDLGRGPRNGHINFITNGGSGRTTSPALQLAGEPIRTPQSPNVRGCNDTESSKIRKQNNNQGGG